LRPIRIGLSIDDHSLKDLVILINSVVESALEPSELVFHIVACGKDHMAAMVLKNSIATSMSNCLPDVKHELVAYMLPPESGFAMQLAQLKKKSNHWNSQSGADMVRFFLPSIFPHAERLLYLDNDIIVSCCLEEVWDTPFETHQIVGIALDDLNWATVTQFKRHYNASHPLVIKNMRRNQPAADREARAGQAISTKEFSAALPRYPNDGMLLIDVVKYNREGILEVLNEIAMANAIGEYAVNLGTQQFTVLGLYDRWKELTPRANLRHFPDMARGYLMWFYYNGFLHYAGQHKPRLLCQTTTAENAQGRIPYLRVMSYTAWALSNYQVHRRCPADHLAYLADCVPHMHEVAALPDLFAVLHRIISVSPDPSLLYIHVGAMHGNLALDAYKSSSAYNKGFYLGNAAAGNTTSEGPSKRRPILGTKAKTEVEDAVQTLSLILLHNSSWSLRAYDYKLSRVESTANALAGAGFKLLADGAVEASEASKKKKGKKEPPQRTLAARVKHFCDAERSPYKSAVPAAAGATAVKEEAEQASGSAGPGCESVLLEIKSEGRAHWDAQVIVIDVTPPDSFASIGYNVSAPPPAKEVPTVLTSTISKHSSLGVLLNLDLVFMRPKIIFVRLAASSTAKLGADTATADRFLRQNGYLTGRHSGPECGSSRITRFPPAHQHSTHAAHRRASAATTTGVVTTAVVYFNCVWGLRVNEFEFFPNLLT
jgi:lipopolysaccharide biosynthesis glycosyltransferase